MSLAALSVPGLTMPPPELLALYVPAMLLCIAIPGPDMLLALSRGLGHRGGIVLPSARSAPAPASHATACCSASV